MALAPAGLVWLGLNLIATGNVCTPTTGVVTFIGNQAGISAGASLQPSTGTVTFTGNVPTVNSSAGIYTNTGVITFTGNRALVGYGPSKVKSDHSISAHWYSDVGHAARFAYVPLGMQVQRRANIVTYEYQPTTGELLFEGNVPVIGSYIVTQPGTGELEFTGDRPTVDAAPSLAPTTGVVTFTGNVPGINTEQLSQPYAGEFLFTGNVPVLELPVDVMAETGYIQFLGYVPTVDINEVFVNTATGVLTFYGNQPTITGAFNTDDVRRKKDAGAKKKRQEERDKLVVVIDDEEFFVESPEEAEHLLTEARKAYTEQVDDLGKQLVAKASDPSVQIKPIKMPRIRADGPAGPELQALIAEVKEMREQIRTLYEQAAAAQNKYVNDDDEALALLL